MYDTTTCLIFCIILSSFFSPWSSHVTSQTTMATVEEVLARNTYHWGYSKSMPLSCFLLIHFNLGHARQN